MTANGTDTASSSTASGNTATAVEFLELASSGRARETFERLGAPDFVHHNPWFAPDAATLAEAMDENARANPGKSLTILRTIAEGPLVAVHSHVRQAPDDRGGVVVHIFRIDDGRIRELWDVGQEVPADAVNERGIA